MTVANSALTRSALPAEHIHWYSGAYRLFGKLYLQDKKAPTILLLHGLGFHTFEYDELAPLLVAGGFNCMAFDYRSHGRSDGPRGYWVLQDLVEDAESAIEFLSQQVQGRIGVFGNSLGALIGVYLAARDKRVRSLVASGCPTRVADFGVTRFRKMLLRILRILAVLFPVRVSLNHFEPYHHILLNPQIIKQVSADPLISEARRFAPSTYADMFEWNALEVITDVSIPLLVLYATRDGLQPPDQSTLLFDTARCEKEIRAIDTGHVPNLENPELLAPMLKDWFDRTLR